MAKRRVHGNFKSLLKRLPDAVADELRAQLTETGNTVLARAQRLAPVYAGKPRKGRTAGTLRRSLSSKLLAKSLKLKVGIVGKVAGKRAYYAGWVERGHRIGYAGNRLKRLEKVDGRTTAGRLVKARRRQDIRKFGVRPHPFLYTFTRQELYQPFQKIWGRAIHKAAAGATSE
jgi:hypothetical protein